MIRQRRLLLELIERVKGLEHEAEVMRTVLIVKEPNTQHAAQAFDGLRKQVIAGAAERRSHLNQLVAMSVAVNRATSVDDLRPQLREWLEQSGVGEVWDVPSGVAVSDFFEDIGGRGLVGAVEILEPAYVDRHTGSLLRLGRARRAAERFATRVAPTAPARVAEAESTAEAETSTAEMDLPLPGSAEEPGEESDVR